VVTIKTFHFARVNIKKKGGGGGATLYVSPNLEILELMEIFKRDLQRIEIDDAHW
jgi:hypothetical protein